MTVQYRLVVSKRDERVEGPDDAAVVVSAPVAIVTAGGFDASVEFMRGKVKATGNTGELLDALKSGDADAAFSRLASEL